MSQISEDLRQQINSYQENESVAKETASVLQLGKVTQTMCLFVNTVAVGLMFYEMYKDPSLLNPWSERASQWTWFSRDHLIGCVAGTASVATYTIQKLVSHIEKQANSSLQKDVEIYTT